MMRDDAALPPRYLVNHYKQAYSRVHRRDPYVRYMGNQWYSVNGETVHRMTLMDEISRLREVAQRQTLINTDRNIIQRLISRLRAL